jgi:predicted Zn-dependent protease
LGNAGRDAPRYHEARVRYVREFLALFPDESDLVYLNMRRAEGDALWDLDRRAEAESVFRALVERQPDEAWGYIGWADRYWLLDDSPKEYETAEAILRRALDRPNLHDRADLLERLAHMYEAWEKPAERDAAWAGIEALQARATPRREPAPLAAADFPPQEIVAAPDSVPSCVGEADRLLVSNQASPPVARRRFWATSDGSVGVYTPKASR